MQPTDRMIKTLSICFRGHTSFTNLSTEMIFMSAMPLMPLFAPGRYLPVDNLLQQAGWSPILHANLTLDQIVLVQRVDGEFHKYWACRQDKHQAVMW